jgi:hypothetical protein
MLPYPNNEKEEETKTEERMERGIKNPWNGSLS